MLTAWARRTFRVVVEPIARFFHRIGLTPNMLTIIGLLLQALVAVIIASGRLQLGGILLIVFAAFDSIDGTLARMTGQVSRFGAFLDSTIDRYAEAVILGGVLVYYVGQGNTTSIYLIYAAIVGSLLVSYTRAKAESLGIACTEGILTRAERVGLLVLGLILGGWFPVTLVVALAILAIGSNLTAVQRVWVVSKATAADSDMGGDEAS